MENSYSFLMSSETNGKLESLLSRLKKKEKMGGRLASRLERYDLETLGTDQLLNALIQTKKPRMFAEYEVKGDGSDWTQVELSILGDLNVHVPVTVFDDGLHLSPNAHSKPFSAHLFFTPGALLRSSRGCTPADWNDVVKENLDFESYFRLYERRLVPLFNWANVLGSRAHRQVVVTIPGIGCGQFAGPFSGQLGSVFKDVLLKILQKHGHKFPNIKVVHYDPYSECENMTHTIDGIKLNVRPLLREGVAQLCTPETYGPDLSEGLLCSFVAWDHVSWPGNDFFDGSRATDDGVKSAATNAMYKLTGVEGSYDARCNMYQPPSPYKTWGEVVERNNLQLSAQCDIVCPLWA